MKKTLLWLVVLAAGIVVPAGIAYLSCRPAAKVIAPQVVGRDYLPVTWEEVGQCLPETDWTERSKNLSKMISTGDLVIMPDGLPYMDRPVLERLLKDAD